MLLERVKSFSAKKSLLQGAWGGQVT